MNKSFIFFVRFCRQLKFLEPEHRLKFWDAIIKYVFDGIKPSFQGLELAVWMQIKRSLLKYLRENIKDCTELELWCLFKDAEDLL